MGALSNCGHDENGQYRGGAAGDQTGDEYKLCGWYNRPWNVVLRHNNTQVRSMISQLAAEAAKNDKIGYDQGQRETMWTQMKNSGYRPANVTVACEADCSSSTSFIVRAAGYLLNIDNLKTMPTCTTQTLRAALTARGFKAFTDSAYLTGSSMLVAGDILLLESGHAAIWTSDNPGSTGGWSDGSTGDIGGGVGSGQSLGVGGYDYVDYIVKEGDTLQSIAEKYHTTPALIMFINNLTTSELKAGQTLKVPTVKTNSSFNPTEGVLSIEKKHTTGVLVSHPTIQVEFYGEYGMLAATSTTGFTPTNDADNDIINVSTIRNMGQDCPTFSISLTWRRNWFQKLASNDLVVIKMQRPPEKLVTVFFGLIDDIRKTTDFSSGQPQRSCQVTGRGFNKMFVNFDVGLIESVSIDTGTGWFSGLLELDGLNSYQAIKTVVDSYVGSAIVYSFQNGKNIKDYFQYHGNEHNYETLVNTTSYTSYNGSLWNFLKQIGNAPFNETYWEINSEKPTLIHRRTPFNKKDWIALPHTVIKDLDIVSDNTGRSDLETYTLFSVELSVLGDETMATTLYRPLWYPPFYPKYGLSQLKVSTSYDVMGGGDSADSSVSSYFLDLFNFNIKNNVFSNGTLIVKGSAAYKVGERVILESENMEYYVESVSHTFNCYGAWTTSLGVTRGIQPAERFTPPFNCAEEMSAAQMNAIINMTGGSVPDWTNLPSPTTGGSSVEVPPEYSGGAGSSGTTSENETKVVEILRSWGLNSAAVAAVCANINAESSFRTSAWGDGGTSVGLCQWHAGRCTALQNFCRTNGYNLYSVEGQMAYLKTELQGDYKSTWNALTSAPNSAQGAYNAAYSWCVDFERPQYKYEKGKERGNNAKYTYYPKYV